MVNCRPGLIYRVAHTRRIHGKRIKIRGKCIKNRGLPGKGKTLFKLRKGTLSQFGYSSMKSVAERHSALRKAVKRYSAGTIIKKLNAVRVLNRNTNPGKARKFTSDMHYVQKYSRSLRSRS